MIPSTVLDWVVPDCLGRGALEKFHMGKLPFVPSHEERTIMLRGKRKEADAILLPGAQAPQTKHCWSGRHDLIILDAPQLNSSTASLVSSQVHKENSSLAPDLASSRVCILQSHAQ